MMSMYSPPVIVAPARSGDIAIEEELAQAREQATLEAYDRFIERHPGHPLTAAARAERKKLQLVR